MINPETIRHASEMACLLEASAEKPGNVTPTHAFHDMCYEDFLHSAVAIGPEIAQAGTRGVGQTILAAIQATKRWVRPNTNLGIVLLLAPLARAALQYPSGVLTSKILRAQLHRVLNELTVDDARAAYAAIRLAVPGGMNEPVEAHDVRTEVPTVTLHAAMALAAQRDSIASEYVTDYAIVFERCLPAYQAALAQGLSEPAAVLQTYLQTLAVVPDTLIARKADWSAAESVSAQAAAIVANGGVTTDSGRLAIAQFDTYLRANGNRLNPGTTADLMTATLFVAQLHILP